MMALSSSQQKESDRIEKDKTSDNIGLISSQESLKMDKINGSNLETATGTCPDDQADEVFGSMSEDENECKKEIETIETIKKIKKIETIERVEKSRIEIKRPSNYAEAQELLSDSKNNNFEKFGSMKSYIDFTKEKTSEIIEIIERLINDKRPSMENEMLNDGSRFFQYLESVFNYTILSLNICQLKIENEESRLILPLYNRDGKPLVYGICSKAHNNGNNETNNRNNRNNRKNKKGGEYAWVIDKMCSLDELCQEYGHYYDNDLNSFKKEIETKLNDKSEISKGFKPFDASLKIEVSPKAMKPVEENVGARHAWPSKKNKKNQKVKFWTKVGRSGWTYDDIKQLLYETIKELVKNPNLIQYQINADTKHNKLIVECVLLMHIGDQVIGWPMEYQKNRYKIVAALTPQMLQHNCYLFDCVQPNGLKNATPRMVVNGARHIGDNEAAMHLSNQMLNGQLRLMAMEGIDNATRTLRMFNESIKFGQCFQNWQFTRHACANYQRLNEIVQYQVYYNNSVIEMINDCNKHGTRVDTQKCFENLIKSFNCSIVCGNVINGSF